MNEDSKKRQHLKKQIASKAQTAPLEFVEKVANVLNSPKKWSIVERVATIPKGIETQKFIISFDYLDWDECVFEQFDRSKGKKLLEILDRVSKCEIARLPELKIIRDSVRRISPYDSLFKNLEDDVNELKETELCDGRIFFFITEPKFHIVSIETKHRNID